MPDVNTSLLQFVLQAIGGNDNSWGDVLNQNFERVETAIAGTASITVTGNVTLSDDQARPAFIMLSGTPGAAATIQYPARARVFSVLNACGGSQTITVKTAAGTGVVVPRGRLVMLYCDGTNVDFVQSASEVGIGGIVMNASDTSEQWDNYLPCLGQNVSRSTYAKLFSRIGTRWGIGDGSTTFTIPSSDTRYARGGQVADVGTLLDEAIKTHTHPGTVTSTGTATVSGSASGSLAVNDYYHYVTGTIGAASGYSEAISSLGLTSTTKYTSGSLSVSGSGTVSASGTFTTGNNGSATETRPKSFSVLYMIRFQ